MQVSLVLAPRGLLRLLRNPKRFRGGGCGAADEHRGPGDNCGHADDRRQAGAERDHAQGDQHGRSQRSGQPIESPTACGLHRGPENHDRRRRHDDLDEPQQKVVRHVAAGNLLIAARSGEAIERPAGGVGGGQLEIETGQAGVGLRSGLRLGHSGRLVQPGRSCLTGLRSGTFGSGGWVGGRDHRLGRWRGSGRSGSCRCRKPASHASHASGRNRASGSIARRLIHRVRVPACKTEAGLTLPVCESLLQIIAGQNALAWRVDGEVAGLRHLRQSLDDLGGRRLPHGRLAAHDDRLAFT